jgi:endonuclease G, mitochondrial
MLPPRSSDRPQEERGLDNDDRTKFYAALVLMAILAALTLATSRARPATIEPAAPWAGDFGFPEGTPRDKGDFVFAYDVRSRNPSWVGCVLTAQSGAAGLERDNKFFPEESLPRAWRSANADYDKSGYDRGHHFPARYARTQAAQDLTFTLAQMSPQVPDCNRGFTKKLEAAILALRTPDTLVYPFSGPIWPEPIDGKLTVKTIGPHGVWVPVGFYKVALLVRASDRQPLGMRAWMFPNEPIDHNAREQQFRVTVRAVQDRTGLDFYAGLPDDVEDAMENK